MRQLKLLCIKMKILNSKIILPALLLVLILFLSTQIFADDRNLDYENQFSFAIRYLGMKVANVKVSDVRQNSAGRIEVEANSVSFGNLLFKINNTYTIDYQDHYNPQKYTKLIRQKNYAGKKTTVWVYQTNRIETWVNDQQTNNLLYDDVNSRDFFSALLFIREMNIVDHNQQVVLVYANNNNWQANIALIGRDRIGRRNALKYRIEFEKISDYATQRSDVLTNNIVKEENALFLWFSDDDERLPLQAEYESSPFSVFWTLERYKI